MTNKELVLKFYDEVFNNWDISNLDNYMKDNYIQHNPTAPSGKEGFVEFTKVFFSLKPHMDIIHIGEDGDCLLYTSHNSTQYSHIVKLTLHFYATAHLPALSFWQTPYHNRHCHNSGNG